MSKTIACVQSNYIPWKGYFDLINLADEFVLYDDVQYTRRDWRNRNKIKTAKGLAWLTIPVQVKGRYYQKIKDTKISDPEWARRHWSSIVHHYSKAKHFGTYRDRFEELYSDSGGELLSETNHRFIVAICEMLGIDTKISWSMEFDMAQDKTERLVNICAQAGATEYISGPSAKDYMDENLFEKAGTGLRYADYSGYPEYDQLHPPFEHQVSIIDLLFSEGPNAPKFMRSF